MAEIQETPAPVFKAFVANIPFVWDDAKLLEAFADLQPQAATVVYHGRRSMGYGFVNFLTAEEVQKAVEALNDKEFEARKIIVEVAKERDPDKPARTAQKQEKSEEKTGGQRTRRPRRRAPRRDVPEGEQPQRVHFPPECTVFVSNLSFKITEDELAAIFGELNIVAKHVARTPSGRCKGFGFVQFATAEEQQKAIFEYNSKTVSDREITVAAARSKPEPVAEAAE